MMGRAPDVEVRIDRLVLPAESRLRPAEIAKALERELAGLRDGAPGVSIGPWSAPSVELPAPAGRSEAALGRAVAKAVQGGRP